MANRLRTPLEARFWANVIPEPNSGCWLWTGYASKGYGRIGLGGRGGKIVNATLVSLGIEGRSVPSGAVVLHRCDTPACVNPDHLIVGTQAANLADMRAKSRHSHGASHSALLRERAIKGGGVVGVRGQRAYCAKGHEKSGDNALVNARGHVRCRQCRNESARISERAKYEAKRAKNGAITIKELEA